MKINLKNLENNDNKKTIRLVEYCSRLADSNLNLPYFKAISCRCIENNVYKDNLDDCSHQFMLGDKDFLFSYISEEIAKDEQVINNKKEAIEKYPLIKENEEYLKLCNLKLYRLSNKKISKKCIDEMVIAKEDYKRKHCSLEGYTTLPHKDCCSVHIQGTNENKEKFDNYYCYNIKNSDKEINAFIEDIKEKREFYDEISVTVEVDCPTFSFSLFCTISLKFLALALLLFIFN